MPGWSELRDAQRSELYKRRYTDAVDVGVLAVEYDMNPISLNRRLQEMRKMAEEGVCEPEEKDKYSVHSEDINNMDVSCMSERITTLEELLDACGVDREVWEVDHWIANTWEGYRKDEKKSLQWVDGAIQEGVIEDTGEIKTTTLYQIKAWLIRKEPVAVEPVIRPVVFTPSLISHVGTPKANAIKKSLIIPDMHVGFKSLRNGRLDPFHDRLAIDLVLQIAEHTEFDNVVLLGDALDMADWSDKFLRSPEYEQNTQPALEELAWILWQLRTRQPDADFYYIEGNHEERQTDMMIKHIPQAYHLRPVGVELDYSAWSIPKLLGLSDLNITWVGGYPDGMVELDENLIAVHGTSLSAERTISDSDVTIIFGHIHRFDVATRTIYTGRGARVVNAYCSGFLGRMDGVVPGIKARQRWSQGFGIVHHSGKTQPAIEHVGISGGQAIYQGQVLEGKSYVEDLCKHTDNLLY